MAQKTPNSEHNAKSEELSPTLSATELQTLLGLLREDVTENETLETIYAGFQHYCNRTDSFKVGCALALLIQLPDLLSNPTQQLATITLLHELYEWDQAICHPFSRVFISLLESENNDEPKESRITFNQMSTDQLKVPLSMKQFLCQLITSPNRDVLKKTARQILNSEPTVKNLEIISAIKSLNDGLVESPATARSAVSVILNDPESKDSFDSEYEVCQELLTGTHPLVEQTFSPQFLRLAPPMYPIEDELVWLNPVTTNVKIIYDKTLCCPVNGGIEAKRLMSKAFKVALTKPQTQHLVSELKKDSQLVHHSGLTPSKLPELVENNPLVAIALLLKLMQSSQITEYFSVLVNMEISLHSMEVVNRWRNTV